AGSAGLPVHRSPVRARRARAHHPVRRARHRVSVLPAATGRGYAPSRAAPGRSIVAGAPIRPSGVRRRGDRWTGSHVPRPRRSGWPGRRAWRRGPRGRFPWLPVPPALASARPRLLPVSGHSRASAGSASGHEAGQIFSASEVVSGRRRRYCSSPGAYLCIAKHRFSLSARARKATWSTGLRMQDTAGTLYIVSTPIGNLDDISARAIDTLRAAAVVAAEDTRHSARLLEQLGLQKFLLSYHDHNEE